MVNTTESQAAGTAEKTQPARDYDAVHEKTDATLGNSGLTVWSLCIDGGMKRLPHGSRFFIGPAMHGAIERNPASAIAWITHGRMMTNHRGLN